MKLNDLKEYTVFLIITGLFLVTTVMSLIVYINYNKKTADSADSKFSLEINLPVIEWGKYDTLSKKYPSDKIE